MNAPFEEQSTDRADGAIVYVVDDDESTRESLRDLLRSAGFIVMTFVNAEDFLSFERPDTAACVVLDVRLRGQSGLCAQERLNENHICLPIIFITAHADIEMSVKALKRGAADFFTKPFRDQDLLDAVIAALDTDRKHRDEVRSHNGLVLCYDSLTPREREVAELMVRGFRNRDIATQMSLSEATVKIYRTQAMKKMASSSLAEFVLKVRALDVA